VPISSVPGTLTLNFSVRAGTVSSKWAERNDISRVPANHTSDAVSSFAW